MYYSVKIKGTIRKRNNTQHRVLINIKAKNFLWIPRLLSLPSISACGKKCTLIGHLGGYWLMRNQWVFGFKFGTAYMDLVYKVILSVWLLLIAGKNFLL